MVPDPVNYLVEPLLEEGCTTVIGGEMGSGKSLFALLLGLQVSIGKSVLELPTKKAVVSYLDYEDEQGTHLRRADLLAAGHPELVDSRILYRRCDRPIPDDPELFDYVEGHRVSVLIIDSLALAAGRGDLQGDEAPRRLHGALRKLKTTNLIIAHPPKNAASFTIHGSGFFQNLPRAVYEQRILERTDGDILKVGLFNRKTNHGHLRPAFGFDIQFQPSAIRFEACQVPGKGLPSGGTLAERLKATIQHHGQPMTVKALAQELGTKSVTVRARLNDPAYKQWFIKVEGDQWTVAQQAE